MSWGAESNTKPAGRILHHFLFLSLQGGAGSGETVEFAIPFLYLLYLAPGWLLLTVVPVPPQCAGGLPIWGFPLGLVGPTLKWHQLWWGYCSSAQKIPLSYKPGYPPSATACSPLDHFRMMWVLKSCLFESLLCSGLLPLQLGQQTVTLPLQAGLYLFPPMSWYDPLIAVPNMPGSSHKACCVFCVIHVIPGWEWVLSSCPLPWCRGELLPDTWRVKELCTQK